MINDLIHHDVYKVFDVCGMNKYTNFISYSFRNSDDDALSRSNLLVP